MYTFLAILVAICFIGGLGSGRYRKWEMTSSFLTVLGAGLFIFLKWPWRHPVQSWEFAVVMACATLSFVLGGALGERSWRRRVRRT